MPQISRSYHRKRIAISAIAAVILFLILYFGCAYQDAARRYQHAEAASRNQAHTLVGVEGYEYIFEPNTQILIDKILPNRNRIIAHIVLTDYQPFKLGVGHKFLDPDIYTWTQLNVLYHHEPAPAIRRYILFTSLASFLTAAGTYGLGTFLHNRNWIHFNTF